MPDQDTTRKIKPYPEVPPAPPPFEYVPTWRDYLPDLARAVIAVFVVMILSAWGVAWLA
jgi:hypothetical protein